jgi:serine protease inhibitor ecotin
MNTFFKLLTISACLISLKAFAQESGIEVKVGREHATEHQLEILKSFPEAVLGEKRVVIFVPHRHGSHGEDFNLEVRVGESVAVDSCNNYVLGNVTVSPRALAGTPYQDLVAKPSSLSLSLVQIFPEETVGGVQVPCQHSRRAEKMIYSDPFMVASDVVMPIVIYTLPELKVEYRGLPGQVEFQPTEP